MKETANEEYLKLLKQLDPEMVEQLKEIFADEEKKEKLKNALSSSAEEEQVTKQTR